MEYVIELLAADCHTVVGLIHTERDGRHVRVKATEAGYSHVTKYRIKARAQKVANLFPGARISQTWGGYVYGTKAIVPAVQSKINKRSAYRSI